MWRNQVEEQFFNMQLIEKLDKLYSQRFLNENYYAARDEKDSSDVSIRGTIKYDKNERRKEIIDFASRIELKEFILDLKEFNDDITADVANSKVG